MNLIDPFEIFALIDWKFAVKSFVAIFVIVDAFGLVPIFVTLLEGYSERDRKAMIAMAVRVATFSLIVFTLIGNLIFHILGISINSFRIAGGIILLIISIEMLFGRRTKTGTGEIEELDKEDIAITPMAIPLMTGPGAITTGIVLMTEASTIVDIFILIINIFLVFCISSIIFSRMYLIYKFLGKTGTKVLTRIMGLLLAAISVQYVIDGIRGAFF
ncbi:MAG: MarC family protein [Candidatus Altiarchaeales archaeon]|nr:MAG: MarC family protein [Candidatus Altiarchaeales archaeon]RLI94237.1 MAG: MarC family protein [Candidatus Altiarchaeales archaeon]